METKKHNGHRVLSLGKRFSLRKGMADWNVSEADDSGIDSDSEHRNQVRFNEGFVFQNNDKQRGYWTRHIEWGAMTGMREQDGKKARPNLPQVMSIGAVFLPKGAGAIFGGLPRNREVDLIVDEAPAPRNRPKLTEDEADNGRDSPPLLEVELTASDEDDDGSVLELVIPLKNNKKYQRVPTNDQDKKMSLFWKIICCLPMSE